MSSTSQKIILTTGHWNRILVVMTGRSIGAVKDFEQGYGIEWLSRNKEGIHG